MRNALAVIISFGALAVWIWFYFVLPQMYQPSTPEPAPQLSSDLYPLYGPASWNTPRGNVFTYPNGSIERGVSTEALVATSTMNPGKYFSPFETYYQQKLRALGWTIDNSLLANGPASGQVVWRKGNDMIALTFDTNFYIRPLDQPEQCPCDVTLSLFSSPQPNSR